MRDTFVKDRHGEIKYERDNNWPDVLVDLSPNARVICAAGGQRIVLQHRHHNEQTGKWRNWVSIVVATSHEQMRKLLEGFYPFAWDCEKLDAICIKTDDGDYVAHSH
jgi:muconolactone delta-isomerase